MNEIKIRSDNKVSVGNNIKQIRQDKNVKAHEMIVDMQLAGHNINKQRYYKLEHDLANVYASELVFMSEYMDVDINEFFKPNTENDSKSKP